MLVRLVTTAGSLGMVQALRDAWPLASVSLVENLVDGRTEAQVLLPNEAEQRQVAKAIAQFSRWQEPLRKLANVLIALLAIVCARAGGDKQGLKNNQMWAWRSCRDVKRITRRRVRELPRPYFSPCSWRCSSSMVR